MILFAVTMYAMLAIFAETVTTSAPGMAPNIMNAAGNVGSSAMLLGAVMYLVRREKDMRSKYNDLLEKREKEHKEQEDSQRSEFLTALKEQREAERQDQREAREGFLSALEAMNKTTHTQQMRVIDLLEFATKHHVVPTRREVSRREPPRRRAA